MAALRHSRRGSRVMRFINDDELKPRRVKFSQPVDIVQRLVSRYCPFLLSQLEYISTQQDAYTSAIPLADLFDCSTSTVNSGPSPAPNTLLAVTSVCKASSTLLTTIKTPFLPPSSNRR